MANVQTQGALSYIGNPDYRGYLSALSQGPSADTGQIRELLSRVGNDAVIGNTTGLQASDLSGIRNLDSQLYSQYQGLTGGNQGAGGLGGAPLPAVAPTLNINAIRSSAQSQAANNVNPLYNQYLNEFLQNQAAETTAQTEQNKATVANLQAQEANNLQGNDISRQSTQQNTALDLQNIANQQKNYQQASGTQFDASRRQLQETQGASGLAGSGLGAQADIQAQQSNQIKQAAQQGQYTYSAQQKQLLENQTFEQLANSDSLSKLKEQEGENTANFSLNQYLRQAADNKQREQEALTEWQQQAIGAQTQNLIAQAVSGKLSGLSGATMAAAGSAWAPWLQTVSAPTAPRSLLV